MQFDECFTLRGRGALIGPALYLRDGDTGALGQVPDGLRKRHFLMQLDELDDVATGATAKTLEEALVRVDVERRRPLLVERAESLPRRSGFLQRHDVANHRDDVRL